MMFVQPLNILRVQEELKKYQELCNQYNHSPAKKEFEDIVKFILLQSGDSGNIFESNDFTIDYLYDNFMNKLNEASEIDAEGEFNTVAGAAIGATKKILGGLAIGAALTGVYIAFLFKKGKLKASLENEKKIEMDKLNSFKKIIDLSIQVSKLKNEPPPKLTDLTQPSTEESPSMPSKPDSPGSKGE
jgi:hypothetical protein